MKESTNTVPGIKFIGWFKLTKLTVDRADLHAIAGESVLIMDDVRRLPVVGEAVCNVTRSHNNGQYTDKLTLEFKTPGDPMLPVYAGFVIVTNEGKSYMVGTKEQYPIIETDFGTGTPSGDPAAVTCKVTMNALRALIPCSFMMPML